MSEAPKKTEWRVRLEHGATLDLKRIFDAIVHEMLYPLQDRIKALESELKEAKSLRYEGTWKSNRLYERGNLCTDRSSLWICKQTTDSRPGTSPDWQLAAKGGAK